MMTNLLFLCALTIAQAVAAPYREIDGSVTLSPTKQNVVDKLTTRFSSSSDINIANCNFFVLADRNVVFWCPCTNNPATFYSGNVAYDSLDTEDTSIICQTQYREKGDDFSQETSDIETELTKHLDSDGNIPVANCNFFGLNDQNVVFWCTCQNDSGTFYSGNVAYSDLGTVVSPRECQTGYREIDQSLNPTSSNVETKLTTRIGGDTNIPVAKCNFFVQADLKVLFWCPCEDNSATFYSGKDAFATLGNVDASKGCQALYREKENSFTNPIGEVLNKLTTRIGIDSNILVAKCNFFAETDQNVVFWCPCENNSETFYSDNDTYTNLGTAAASKQCTSFAGKSTCEKINRFPVTIEEKLKTFIGNSPALNVDTCTFEAQQKDTTCTLTFKCDCKNTHKSFFRKAIYSDKKSIENLGTSAEIQKCQLDKVRLVLVIVIPIVLLAIIAIVVAKILKVF